jgi:hypothetical protein
MNDNTFQFLDEEIRLATAEGSPSKAKQLKAIRGYLQAAKDMRGRFGRYEDLPKHIERFDIDCARVSP